MSSATRDPKTSLNTAQLAWLKRMGVILNTVVHMALPSSTGSASNLGSGNSQERAPVVQPAGPVPVPGVSTKRVVAGGGGYEFEQHADGKIFITKSPKHGNERIEVKDEKM